ncbi:hypothetical protein ACFOGJ_06565 [Marinibaculum pumilum]|uniref:Uncharacterized protein n=1 Tax=Marinibaculum pumilum TaxID=1766165 RepID=A0ABV7KWW2_9PROT
MGQQAWHQNPPKSETKTGDSKTLNISFGLSGCIGQMTETSQYAFNIALYGLGLSLTMGIGQMDQYLNAMVDLAVDGSLNEKNGHHAMKVTGVAAEVNALSKASADLKSGAVGVDSLVIGTFQSKAAIQTKIPGIEING